MAGCWLDFTSLNTIMDLATRRNQFEMSSAALFTGYSLFIVLAAGQVCYSGRKVDGYTRILSKVNFPPRRLVMSMPQMLTPSLLQNFLILYIAFLLFSRCAVELGITAWAFGPTKNRQRIQVGQDIAYGAITTIALTIMAFLADDLQPYDEGGGPGLIIKSNIRRAVLRTLELDTMQGSKPPPPLMDILRHLEDEYKRKIDSQRVFSGTALDGDERYEVALDYVRELKEKEGSRRPPRATRNSSPSAFQAAPQGQYPFASRGFQAHAGAGSSTSSSSRTSHRRAADFVGSHTQQARMSSAPTTLGRGVAAAAAAPPPAAARVFSPPPGDRTVSDGSRNPYRWRRPAANEDGSVRSAGGQMWEPAESIEMGFRSPPTGFRSEMQRGPGRSPLSTGGNGYTP